MENPFEVLDDAVSRQPEKSQTRRSTVRSTDSNAPTDEAVAGGPARQGQGLTDTREREHAEHGQGATQTKERRGDNGMNPLNHQEKMSKLFPLGKTPF